MNRGRRIGIAVLAVVITAQLVPVSRTNPPVNGEIDAPPDVRALLERSCYDCHSNETVWPWYSRVAPASWLVARDVRKARDELNFSEWADYSEKRLDHKLEEIDEHVEDREMPAPIYLPLHPEARLSDAERETLVGWSRSERASAVDGAEEAADDLTGG
jgi:hypothetical protein